MLRGADRNQNGRLRGMRSDPGFQGRLLWGFPPRSDKSETLRDPTNAWLDAPEPGFQIEQMVEIFISGFWIVLPNLGMLKLPPSGDC